MKRGQRHEQAKQAAQQGSDREVHDGQEASGTASGAGGTPSAQGSFGRSEEVTSIGGTPVNKWRDRDPGTEGHQEGVLEVGTPVWYRGGKYWVEWLPGSWLEGHCVRIADVKIDPTPGRLPAVKRTSFCVHADLLMPAATKRRPTDREPTLASAKRAERAAAGAKDVGDEVANLLREAGDIDGVFWVAAKYLSTTVDALKEKYAHLDNGRKRMVLGNRLRALHKKGAIKL
jgi:hypothetical protein